MALRAGYYGVKRFLRDKLEMIAGTYDETIKSLFPRSEQAVLGAVGIFPLVFEQGAINAPISTGTSYANLKTDSTKRIRTQDVVNVSSGKWLISVDFKTYEVNAIPFNSEGKAVYPIPSTYNSWSSSIITIDTTDAVKGVALAIRRKDGEDITTSELDVINPLITSAMTNRDLTETKVNTSAIGTNETGETTASKSYNVGDHFYKNGKFCTAIASIAQGATFTLNTNYVEGTVADKLTYKDMPLTLNTAAPMPTDFTEGIVKIQLTGSPSYIALVLPITNSTLTSNDTAYRTGYYVNSGSNAYAQIKVSQSSILIDEIFLNSTQQTSIQGAKLTYR